MSKAQNKAARGAFGKPTRSPLQSTQRRKSDRRPQKPTLCENCGANEGPRSTPTVVTQFKVVWDGSQVRESVCARCGRRTVKRLVDNPPLFRRNPRKGSDMNVRRRKGQRLRGANRMSRPKEYGFHISGVRGGPPREGEE